MHRHNGIIVLFDRKSNGIAAMMHTGIPKLQCIYWNHFLSFCGADVPQCYHSAYWQLCISMRKRWHTNRNMCRHRAVIVCLGNQFHWFIFKRTLNNVFGALIYSQACPTRAGFIHFLRMIFSVMIVICSGVSSQSFSSQSIPIGTVWGLYAACLTNDFKNILDSIVPQMLCKGSSDILLWSGWWYSII